MMKPVVQKLTLDDMIAIVAYRSSRMPSAGAKPASAEEIRQSAALAR